jgi:hypothetical protein
MPGISNKIKYTLTEKEKYFEAYTCLYVSVKSQTNAIFYLLLDVCFQRCGPYWHQLFPVLEKQFSRCRPLIPALGKSTGSF